MKQSTHWSNELLQELIAQALMTMGKQEVVCYTDALDECPEDDIRDMISFLEGLGEVEKEVEFRVCFSSRHYPEISIRTGLQLILELEESHKTDLSLFIDARLNIGTVDQAEAIREEILRKSSNIFLWVVLVVHILNKEFDRGRIKALKKRLGEIPLGLHDLFLDILTRDQRNMDELLVCIQTMLFCKRPFSPEELQHAIEIGCNTDQAGDQTQMTADHLRKFVLDTSKGLAEITVAKDPTVQFIHESVRDFLLREGGLQQLFPEINNFEAQGHDTLKRICLEQVQPQWKGSTLRDYYALKNLLFHADRAQQGGVDQSAFLSAFNTEAWGSAMEHGPANYVPQQHIIYHLAECDYVNLIRVHPETSDHLTLLGGRYSYPLVAALYRGHCNAARALVGLPSLCDQLAKVEKNPKQISSMDKRRYSSKRHIYTYLCEFGNIELFKALLETSEAGESRYSERDSLRRQCLKYASNEGILEFILKVFCPYTSGCDIVQDRVLFGFPAHEKRLLVETFPDLPVLISTLYESPSLLFRDQFWGEATSLISYAAEKSFTGVVELCFLDKSYSETPHALDLLCSTILSCLTIRERVAMIRLLLDAGVDFRAAQESRPGLLHDLIIRRDIESSLKLLLLTPNVNIEEAYESHGTPLLMAICRSEWKIAAMLLTAGADTMARDTNGNAALALAFEKGHHETCQLILRDPRTTVDAQNHDGQTALWSAVSWSWPKPELLLELINRQESEPNSKDKSGQTFLMYAIRNIPKDDLFIYRSLHHMKLPSLLISSPKTDPSLPSDDGLTPLQLAFLLFQNPTKSACLTNNWWIIRFLLLTGRVNPPYPYVQPYPPSFPAPLVTLVDCFHRCHARNNMDELNSLSWSHHEGYYTGCTSKNENPKVEGLCSA